MKGRILILAALLATSLFCLAKADGSWLKKVSQADRGRANPYAGKPDAVAAGENLFHSNCAKCHGNNAEGKGSRPSLKSERVKNATDGELAWLLKNGNVFKGMPRWSGLPEQQRWQIVTYIRSLNIQTPEGQQ
jgi:mono/diheme cytochrome c family protein